MRRRIVIADDNRHFVAAISLVLEAAKMDVVCKAYTGRQAVDATIKHNPDIILLDISMPDMDGLAALTVIVYLCPDTRVIILSGNADPKVHSRAMDLGADAYIHKSEVSATLLESIRELGQENPIDTSPSQSINEFANEKSQRTFNELSKKEIQILHYLSQGIKNAEISKQLSISRNTLKSHLKSIYRKLDCNDRTQAAIWAIQIGIDSIEIQHRQETSELNK